MCALRSLIMMWSTDSEIWDKRCQLYRLKEDSCFAKVKLRLHSGAGAQESLRLLNCVQAHLFWKIALSAYLVRICPRIPFRKRHCRDRLASAACGICAAECPASAIQLSFERKEDVRRIGSGYRFCEQENAGISRHRIYCRYASPVGPPSKAMKYTGSEAFVPAYQRIPSHLSFRRVLMALSQHLRRWRMPFQDGAVNKEYIKRQKDIERNRYRAEGWFISKEEDLSEFRKKIESLVWIRYAQEKWKYIVAELKPSKR